MSTFACRHRLLMVVIALVPGCQLQDPEEQTEPAAEMQPTAARSAAGAEARSQGRTLRAGANEVARPDSSVAGRVSMPAMHMHGEQAQPPSAGDKGAEAQPMAGQSASAPSLAATFVVPLTAADESKACAAAGAQATAIGSASVSGDGQSLAIVVSYSGLSSEASGLHLHFGERRADGPIVIELEDHLTSPIRRTLRAADYMASGEDVPATFADFLSELKNGKSYFNLHTQACESGELRGQIEEQAPEQAKSIQLSAKLTGTEETMLCRQGSLQAVGTGTVDIAEDEKSVALRVSHTGLSGPLTMGHVHIAPPGQDGPVVLDLGNVPAARLEYTEEDYNPTSPDAPKTFAEVVQALKDGRAYFNLHTTACASGELRGQIRGVKRHWSDAPSEFQTRLEAGQETMACAGAGANAIALAGLVISADEKQLAVQVAHDSLSGPLTQAHIHFAEEGSDGPVVLDLGKDLPSRFETIFKAADYVAKDGGPVDFDALIAAIRAGNTYLNLHTAACGMGEVRGQITP